MKAKTRKVLIISGAVVLALIAIRLMFTRNTLPFGAFLLAGIALAYLIWRAFVKNSKEELRQSARRESMLSEQISSLKQTIDLLNRELEEKNNSKINVVGLNPILHLAVLNIDSSFTRPYIRQKDNISFFGALRAEISAEYGIKMEDVLFKYDRDSNSLFLKNFHPEGGFGYTGKSHTSGLSAVGALCMQLMGQGNHDAVKKTLKVMDDWTLGWGGSGAMIEDKKSGTKKPIPLPPGVPTFKQNLGSGTAPQYYAYYATQAMFQAGGDRWKRWNKMMSEVYPKVQIVTKKGESKYVDHKGQPQDIGYFQNDDQYGDRPVMDTCLATLQLEVYYRYLPTFKEVKVDDAEIVLGADDEKSVKTTIEW